MANIHRIFIEWCCNLCGKYAYMFRTKKYFIYIKVTGLLAFVEYESPHSKLVSGKGLATCGLLSDDRNGFC